MAAKRVPQDDPEVRLDNLTLARKEGWQRFVDTAARIPPEPLTRTQLDALGERAVEDYNRQRREWHANLGPIKTPQLAALHEDLWDIVDSNAQDGDKAKGAVAIDAFPGLGKTTSVLAFAKQFHRREIREQGTATGAGHERWPVCRVGLTGNTGMVEFNRAMLAFFAHPGMSRGNAAHFAHRALDCILTCETKLLIVDDLHFLRWRQHRRRRDQQPLQIHRQRIPGHPDLRRCGIGGTRPLLGGLLYEDAVIAQTGRRTTKIDVRPFVIDTDEGRREWRQLLLALEQRIVLAEEHPGMLADDLSDYLFARSTGHIGSLMTLINRGCQRAVRTGAERLTRELMDLVKNDAASEKARQELDMAFETRRLTTRIGKAG